MYHSKLMCAGLFFLVSTPLCAQTVIVPSGAPMPNFQPGFNYVFPPGYQTPPGGWQAPSNVGISVGGVNFSVGATQMQSIYGAAQDAARAAAAGGGTAANYQFLVPLDGLNVNVLDGGVALPANVGTPTLIQSGSSLMIGSTPPVVGSGGSAKPAEKDKSTNENEKGRSVDSASSGKPSTDGPSASVVPARPAGGGTSSVSNLDSKPSISSVPGASSPETSKGSVNDPAAKPIVASTPPPSTSVVPGGGASVPPDKKSPNDPATPQSELKPGQPPASDQPTVPSGPPRIVLPDGGPTPRNPRPVEPTPTGAPRTVAATPVEIRTRDPVAERIDLGLERNVGATPPIMHRIDNIGVAVPDCLGASREGMACQ